MQIALVKPQVARRATSVVATAPLTIFLAALSMAITLAIAIATIVDGRVPTNGPQGLICAAVLAAVAATESTRPARSDRVRRRLASAARGARPRGASAAGR
jgi:hypothetical protein